MFYFDPLYILLVAPALLFSIFAALRVKTTFKKYSQMRTARGMTGADAAKTVLSANGVYDVRIEQVSGNLSDHFDPKNKVIRLSDAVYNAASPAAVGVAAHEAGHAVQYAQNYAPIRLRAAIIPATNIGSKLSVPLVLLGILFMRYSDMFYWVAVAGIVCFGLCVLFQLITLPTEYNASRRALRAIEGNHLLLPDEQKGAKKVLSAAALTYVAALSVSLMQMLRLVLRLTSYRRRY
ncbi:MAG: zinc metallopeptidase [Oscillospiraceae bacterium]|nr:zinc metallopeptidase [Oscillospiraceae bacterium]